MSGPFELKAVGPLALGKRDRLPDALRVLVEAYPRVSWEGHANFGQLVQFWMQRHVMFRQLVQILQTDAKLMAEKDIPFADYSARLSHFAGTLLNELHTHHHIEDNHYFPQLVGLDVRVAKGFELLETDHEALDGVLHALASEANLVLKQGDVGVFLEQLNGFDTLLDRHLTDEEEIIVPVILQSGFAG